MIDKMDKSGRWLCKCHNPNLGLATKAKTLKGASQECNSGSHSHFQECECEGMNPHTPKWTLTLGVGVPMESQIFKKWFQKSKFIGLKSFLYHWKTLKMLISKMGLHDPFEYLWHKLWPKERSGVKMSIWLPITKNQESLWITCLQVACHILLKSSRWGVQLYFLIHLNRKSPQEVMGLQTIKNPNFWNFKIPNVGVPRKVTFGCKPYD